MQFTTQQKGQNKSGTTYALVTNDSGGYLVMVLCHNYSQGRTNATWRVCNKFRQSHSDYQRMTTDGLSLEEATAMYNKKLAGKIKH